MRRKSRFEEAGDGPLPLCTEVDRDVAAEDEIEAAGTR
jgi:hypothetical protein